MTCLTTLHHEMTNHEKISTIHLSPKPELVEQVIKILTIYAKVYLIENCQKHFWIAAF